MTTSVKGNNLASLSDREAIEDEAGLWLARIDGRQLKQEEVRELLAWMRRSDFHREYLIALARHWDGMAVLNKLATLFPLAETEMVPGKSGAGGKGRGGLKWLTHWQPAVVGFVAISLVMVAMVMGWQSPFLFDSDPAPQTYITAVGETGRYLLADGSTITLNTNSRVQVNYNNAQRKVTLIRGEANFDVVRDTKKPFMVYAGSGVVQAVGTAFNVRFSESNSVDVIVTEGRVSVIRQYIDSPDLPALDMREQAPTLLDAGQRIQYSEAVEAVEPEPIQTEVLARKLAWQKGSLIFKGETLEQAVAEISRYTNKQLVIADASLNLLEVGGRYRTDNIDNLLSSLADVMNIEIQYLPGDKVHLLARKSK